MIIYFSGPHGAGKSSLIKGVESSSPNILRYKDRLEFVKVEDPRRRHKSKIVKYYQEYCDMLNFHDENPGKIILGDRSLYDGYAYGRAFVNLGWLDKDDCQLHEKIIEMFFEKDEKPQHIVILNPPLEAIIERLHKRWETKSKKWREDNFEYLKAVHEEFRQIPDYFDGKRLLYLGDEMTVEESVSKTAEWVHQPEFIKEYEPILI
ncbi:deoxynucleoside kinase [Candidatus Woesearchaeota archaeon]|nr:deoxynucleoside kinase [Candidatus Woesearchaeota archaeon]